MAYELIFKPTFLNQLLGTPSAEQHNIQKKLELLLQNPKPDAKNKKRLTGYKKPLYRIRAGDYRIVYDFSESGNWVSLVGVDLRKDIYVKGELVAESPDVDLSDYSQSDDLELAERIPQAHSLPIPVVVPDDTTELLPRPLDVQFLKQLRITDPELVAAFTACTSFKDLCEANVPSAMSTRVFDALYQVNYNLVLEQQSFISDEVEDLFRSSKGEFVPFLLKLGPSQDRFVRWALNGNGPVLVKGGPGCGKSTVALHCTKAILRSLLRAGIQEPRILFTSYTNALVNSSKEQLIELLGADQKFVDVRTADSQVHRILRSQGIDVSRIQNKDELKNYVAYLKATLPLGSTSTIKNVSNEYLIQEIFGIIVARDLTSIEDYLNAPRRGRRVPLTANQRRAIWQVYQALSDHMRRQDRFTWEHARVRALELVRNGTCKQRFDAVVIDEAQDLDPAALAMLAELCQGSERIFCTADANQSIYGSGFNWSDASEILKFRGRTRILKQSYRSTREIGAAAAAYLGDSMLDEPIETFYVKNGDLPTFCTAANADEEAKLITEFVRASQRQIRVGTGAVAVLARTHELCEALTARLIGHGMDAVHMTSKEFDLKGAEVKILTLKSAKGLEFPIVAIAGASEKGILREDEDSEEKIEAVTIERRTMYVAMTRAMRALLIVGPTGSQPPVFQGIKAPLWNIR